MNEETDVHIWSNLIKVTTQLPFELTYLVSMDSYNSQQGGHRWKCVNGGYFMRLEGVLVGKRGPQKGNKFGKGQKTELKTTSFHFIYIQLLFLILWRYFNFILRGSQAVFIRFWSLISDSVSHLLKIFIKKNHPKYLLGPFLCTEGYTF